MKTYILVAEEASQSTTVLAIQAVTLQAATELLGLEKVGETATDAFAPGVAFAVVRATSSSLSKLSNALNLEHETDVVRGVQAGWISRCLRSSFKGTLLLGEIRTCP